MRLLFDRLEYPISLTGTDYRSQTGKRNTKIRKLLPAFKTEYIILPFRENFSKLAEK